MSRSAAMTRRPRSRRPLPIRSGTRCPGSPWISTAVLTSTGGVGLNVVSARRTGEAAVFASIDSVERVLTLRAEPGPIDSLLLDHNGEILNGRAIVVQVGVPFALRLRARDLYGNE